MPVKWTRASLAARACALCLQTSTGFGTGGATFRIAGSVTS
jgi:hypothetical protein